MAPQKESLFLQIPSEYSHQAGHQSTMLDLKRSSFYLDSPAFSTSSSPTAFSDIESSAILYARTLTPNIFDRPRTSRSPTSRRFRKNMKDITGYGTTEEEFEALPIAVRRKYFNITERLQLSSQIHALNELPRQSYVGLPSLSDRRGVNLNLAPVRKPFHRVRPSSVSTVSSNDSSFVLTTPKSYKQSEYTFIREETVIHSARTLRESVVFVPAGEQLKVKRRRSRTFTSLSEFSFPATRIKTMDSGKDVGNDEAAAAYAAEMYETFRWMDEDTDLDLKLDSYHANLEGAVVPTSASSRKPSFRRQMSVTKIPFGRTSISSHNNPRSPSILERPTSSHTRQKSRTMSLINPRHLPKSSVASIDPNAAHYQDPEARKQLKLYLATPQNFDEAIEYGFPAIKGETEVAADKENRSPKQKTKVASTKKSSSTGVSFLHDDAESLFEDDFTMVDPESPMTPSTEMGFESQRATPPTSKACNSPTDFSHLGITKPTVIKQADPLAQALTGDREMTLRMTLTRPDLRADEATIYGWQNQNSKVPAKEEVLPEVGEKSGMVKGPFGGIDGWGPDEKENGVVKRFWNKVKSTQKKSS